MMRRGVVTVCALDYKPRLFDLRIPGRTQRLNCCRLPGPDQANISPKKTGSVVRNPGASSMQRWPCNRTGITFSCAGATWREERVQALFGVLEGRRCGFVNRTVGALRQSLEAQTTQNAVRLGSISAGVGAQDLCRGRCPSANRWLEGFRSAFKWPDIFTTLWTLYGGLYRD